jgi:protein phosphatase 1 regulatory subunit 7
VFPCGTRFHISFSLWIPLFPLIFIILVWMTATQQHESSQVSIGIDIDVNSEDEEFVSQHYRIKKIENLERCRQLKKLAIIASCVDEITGLDHNPALEHLEIYQGLLKEIKCIEHLVNLRVLDLSFNEIRRIEGLDTLHRLEELYLSNNKITEISGLGNLRNLKVLELGSNRIKTVDVDCMRSLTELEELWLGKNKISNMGDFTHLYFPKLEQLSLQSNRLTEWSGELFSHCARNLKNVYLGSNALPDPDPQVLNCLNPDVIEELDLSCNRLTKVPQFSRPMTSLTELWLNDNQIQTTEGLNMLNICYPNLRTIYIERNPVHAQCPLDCRNTILLSAPSTLEQIDATMIRSHQIRVNFINNSHLPHSIMKH